MNLPVQKLQPGQVLARHVVQSEASMLLAKGTVLTDQDIRRLKMWGVDTVEVLGREETSDPPSAAASPPADVWQQAEAHMHLRFKLAPATNPAVLHLKNLATQRKAAQLARQAEQKNGECR